MIYLCEKEIADKYYSEEFMFIIDNPRLHDEDEYNYARNFLKELNLKGDYVGWCTIKNPSYEAVKAILDKAKSRKVKIRGYYTLTLSPYYESEWYNITGYPISSVTDITESRTYTDGENKYYLGEIKAFAIPKNAAVTDNIIGNFATFREDAVKALQKNGFSGVDLLWFHDSGRFEAPNYFQAFPEVCTDRCYTGEVYFRNSALSAKDFEKFTDISKILFERCKNVYLNLPFAVDADSLPDTDFVGIYPKHTINNRLLVRKRCRDFLIESGFAKPEYFEPVITVANPTAKSVKPLIPLETAEFRPIPQTIKEQINDEFEKHKRKKKPKRTATEKLALQVLRSAKKDNPDYYNKKASAKALADIPDERLVPYCKVADGGVLSDEYTFLSIKEINEETKEFWKDQALENTDIIGENALVFAKAADGEYVLLLPDSKVVRYQQGELGFTFEWDHLPSFFVEVTE
ncbi:MAG: hypothetical protein IJN38_09240 [Clostridia bacterium]|nr:hypothetical protein [Clostridia bacterium]